MTPPEVPQRGDVCWLDLNPQAGREQAGRRPVLVLSPRQYNGKVQLALCCPITTKAKGYPFEVPLPDGLPVTGVVLADQVRSLDWRVRRAEWICSTPDAFHQEVLRKLRTLI